MEVSLPAFAHRVTVFGSTRNIVATSAGVSSGSASGVRADMCTASPPGPVLRSCVLHLACLVLRREPVGMSHMANRDHIAITTGDTSTTRSKVFVAACPVVRLICVTLRDSSDTHRRAVPESEKLTSDITGTHRGRPGGPRRGPARAHQAGPPGTPAPTRGQRERGARKPGTFRGVPTLARAALHPVERATGRFTVRRAG